MQAVSEIIELNTKLIRMHAAGLRAVDIGELIDLLSSWIQRHSVPPPQLETEKLFEARKWEIEVKTWEAAQHRYNEHHIEAVRSVVTNGQAAIKYLILGNGGAAIALLAFIAQVSAGQPEAVKPMALPLLLFTLGVLLAASCASGAYLGSLMNTSEKAWANKAAVWMNGATIAAGFGSLAVFLVGAVSCYRTFAGY